MDEKNKELEVVSERKLKWLKFKARCICESSLQLAWLVRLNWRTRLARPGVSRKRESSIMTRTPEHTGS